MHSPLSHTPFQHFLCCLLLLLPLCSFGEDAVKSGDLILTLANGEKRQALGVSADADIEVNGMIAHTQFVQRFYNDTDGFVEGEYVFPLPTKASVDNLEIKVGSRTIKGQLKEKQQAKAIYNKARKAGKRAAKLTQSRPNLFRIAVTNIPPGETIEVRLSYVSQIQYDAGTYSMMVPMTLTPRFTPNNADATNRFFNPPFWSKAEAKKETRNPIRLSLQLNAGFTIKNLKSTSHTIDVSDISSSQKALRFALGMEPMDRDFHLSWQQANTESVAKVFIESMITNPDEPLPAAVQEHYAMLMFTPPATAADNLILSREVVFIIDTSGSMGGASIRQAKAALMDGLDRLSAYDTFNVIEFNSDHSALFSHAKPVSPRTLKQARRFVANLNAGGGTNMKPALLEALKPAADFQERLKQVIFITDGAVSNEDDLMRTIHKTLGQARLFSVAIGSAPNEYLFRQTAKFGKGDFVQISRPDQVQKKMQRLFEKLQRPVMRDIEIIDTEGNLLAREPEVIPDIYAGEPVIAALKLASPSGQFIVRGKLAGNTYERTIDLKADQKRGVAKVWAKARLESLMDKMTLNQGDAAALKQEIIALSIKHHILTKFTSFVAVDNQVVRDPNAPMKNTKVANLLPKGTAFPKTSIDALPMYVIGILIMLAGVILRVRRGRLA